jgi:hypothetical protein
MKRLHIILFVCVAAFQQINAQIIDSVQVDKYTLDSLYIIEVQDKNEFDKVLHAEPLYIDLIRDLGARKGEKEWNVGVGIFDKENYNEYETLVEYEWAPVNRLGLEVELPFSFYLPFNGVSNDSVPLSKLNSVKLAAQYTFFVSEKLKTSMAIGYIHELEMTPFSRYRKNQLFTGNQFNPFVIFAKRFGQNFHFLNYSGPQILQEFYGKDLHTIWQVNTNFHYMITGTRNFIGVELNKEIYNGNFDMVIRPQMRVGVADNLLIGIVTGIPINRRDDRFSTFLRLIYEPGHVH